MKDIIGGLLALIIAFGGGYFYGKHVEAEAQQVEVDRLNTEARAKEKALTAAVATTSNALRVSNEKAKMATKERNAAIDNGTYRLRVPVKATCPISPTSDPTAASGDNPGEARAELDPAFGKALYELTDEGDRAITKLNACIDLYNKALESQKEIK